MHTVTRIALIAALVAGMGVTARADDDAPAPPSQLEQAKQSINAMRETYASVVRKEEEAKAEHDPVRLNCVHQNSARIADLVSVADHALDDLRVAISTRQPEEAVEGEQEKISLTKSKVGQLQKEADRCVGIKVVGADNGEGETIRDFSSTSNSSDDPVTTLVSTASMPGVAAPAPPASPVGTDN